ncbi:MAG TPA: nucleoside-diphosphate sugar epimerase/dehydratase [Verrucomicrobiae bacterium]|nr:nucleoside-diphosphate sugar epimerase/dehydratase [Verrucomicrobiae bacterium]
MDASGNGNNVGRSCYDFCRQIAFEFSAGWRIPVVSVVYTVGLVFSLWLSYELRFDFSIPTQDYHQFLGVALWLIPAKLALLLLIGHFAGLLSYFSIPDLKRLFYALATGSLLAAASWIATGGRFAPPRSVILADGLVSLLVLAAIRLVFRRFREVYLNTAEQQDVRVSRIGIIGAGDAGATLARELLLKNRLGLRPIVFFDDDSSKWNRRLHGLPVVGAPEMLLDHRRDWRLDKVIIAIPSAPGRRVREIVNVLQQAGLRFETVPSMDQLATGRVKVSQIRPVEIEDLLGREPVQLETANIRKVLEGRVVMVTGAGGSIGSELCRQIATYNPRSLLLVERSEVQLFPIEQQLNRLGHGQLIVPLIADILDRPRMQAIFKEHRPQVVFHAAAHKHVPIMESHPCEAIKNNSLGTARLALLALKFGVSHFVLISTDKAINPTSVMGATKRLAEIFVQSLWASQSDNGIDSDQPEGTGVQFAAKSHRRPPGPTRFMAVRFGNVLGSSGSVIPTFKEQIAAGGPVTVTHPEVTRYFMTIPEAVGLVLQSAAQGKGGEIFVLDMGKPIRIVNLARQLIELSGLKPGEDIEIKFTGLRPGEKLFEELSHESENLLATNHPKILRFISRPLSLETVEAFLEKLSTELHRATVVDLKRLLQTLVPEYHPCLEPATNGNGNENGGGNGNGHGASQSVTGEPQTKPTESTKPQPVVAH